MSEVADLALGELAEADGIVLVEWGDVVESTLGDHLVVRLEPVDGDDERHASSRSRRRRSRRGAGTRCGPRLVDAALRGVAMLILGIETATEQVSVAIGGHEGVLGLFEVCRGRRHAETLTPAIEFVCAQADIELDEIGAIAVDVGPGLFTGMRVGLAAGQGDGPGAAGADDRDLARSTCSPSRCATPTASSSPVIDARKGEVFYALYRPVPAGCSGSREPRSGRSTTSSPTCSPAGRTSCASVTARCATARRSSTAVRCEIAEQFLAHPSAAPLVQLAHARALARGVGQPVGDPADVPAPSGRRDQLGDARAVHDARRATMSVLARLLRVAPAPTRPIVIEPMRRRHLGRRCWRSSRVVPEAVDRAACSTSELEQARAGERYYIVARRGTVVVGYAGLMFVGRRRPRHEHRGRRRRSAQRIAHAAAGDARRGRRSTAAARR